MNEEITMKEAREGERRHYHAVLLGRPFDPLLRHSVQRLLVDNIVRLIGASTCNRHYMISTITGANIVYIESQEGHVIDFLLGLYVCLYVSQSIASFSSFWSAITLDADKRIVNIMKVYIKTNNLQLELI